MAPQASKRTIVLWLVGYVVLVAGIILAMTAFRRVAIASMGSAAAQSAWDTWRSQAAKEDGTKGPVRRSVPKSPEPPALVLMRDHFPAAVIGLLLPLSALYAVVAWMSWGLMRSGGDGGGDADRPGGTG